MCSDPKTFEGLEVSCRECNECCATYKNTWVARCLAELKTHPHALTFTLTYANNPDGTSPLGARVFRYKDVQDMWKRLRYHGVKTFGADFMVRYVVVGEMGTRRGRCHYHGVMFSNHPIKELGKITNSKGAEVFRFKKRLDWSIWGNGYVEFQPATREGISYALKYILKSRMTVQRAEGTHREGKTEWLASSYLWCSKLPAIGSIWLNEKLSAMFEKAMCFPSLRVPTGEGGDWYLSGEVQKRVCLRIKSENDLFRAAYGRDLAGFQPLLESVSRPVENVETGELTPRKAMEWLQHGETDERNERDEARDVEEFATLCGAREDAQRYSTRARKCFGVQSCARCRAFRSEADNAEDATAELFWRDEFEEFRKGRRGIGDFVPFHEWITSQGLHAYGCLDFIGREDELRGQSQFHGEAVRRLAILQGPTDGKGKQVR